jgi:hypothetical protein
MKKNLIGAMVMGFEKARRFSRAISPFNVIGVLGRA